MERCRAIFELAVNQPVLDMPEVLWKAYIDFEFNEEEYDNTRQLYLRLLDRTSHVKVYVSFAQFELSIPDQDTQENTTRARQVFEDAYKTMKEKELKEEVSTSITLVAYNIQDLLNADLIFSQRVVLLESWKDFEENHGTKDTLETVMAKMPKTVKRSKKRKTEDTEGEDSVVYEEYYDYIFPDDETQKPNLKLLQMANAWKLKQAQMSGGGAAAAAVVEAEPVDTELADAEPAEDED